MQLRTIITYAGACLLVLLLGSCEQAPSPEIHFLLGETPQFSVSLAELKDEVKEHEIVLYDVEYKKEKKIPGLSLQ